MDSPEWRRIEELERLIATTPAATLGGARVIAEFLVECAVDDDGDSLETVAIRSLAATLDRLAGSRA